jgi:hypothetical protein
MQRKKILNQVVTFSCIGYIAGLNIPTNASVSMAAKIVIAINLCFVGIFFYKENVFGNSRKTSKWFFVLLGIILAV